MAKPYVINITDGVGSSNVLTGSYSVSAAVSGYDNSSIDPASLVVDAATLEYTLKISATGTLTLHVSENGTESGVSIVGAKFVRCDKDGNSYGNEIVSDVSGNAVFNNVPFSSDSEILIYYKQTASDSEHDFDTSLKSISMADSTKTEQIINSLPSLKQFGLVDANYENLPINGSITLS